MFATILWDKLECRLLARRYHPTSALDLTHALVAEMWWKNLKPEEFSFIYIVQNKNVHILLAIFFYLNKLVKTTRSHSGVKLAFINMQRRCLSK